MKRRHFLQFTGSALMTISLSELEKAYPQVYCKQLLTNAEAVVTQQKGDRVELYLGGINSQSLEAFDKAFFTVVNGSSAEFIKLESRQGLIGQGKLIQKKGTRAQLKPGTLLQERICTIPKNFKLKIGLDNSLDSITAIQVSKALQAFECVSVLPLEQESHYVFGRMTNKRYEKLKEFQNLPVVGSFGLFLPAFDQIVPNSFGRASENITAAVQRLQPKFKCLLAARIVKHMLGNENTSRVKVRALFSTAEKNEFVDEAFTVRAIGKKQAADIWSQSRGNK